MNHSKTGSPLRSSGEAVTRAYSSTQSWSSCKYFFYLDFPDSDASAAAAVTAKVFCFVSCCNLIQLPTPTATAPTACAAPEAKMAPPAPLAMAGIAGMLPTVMRMALRVVITLGCSVVSRSSALHAFRSQAGTSVVMAKINS